MTILFNKWISHFIIFVQACESNVFTTNHHLLVVNGHNFHVTCAQNKGGGVAFDYIAITQATLYSHWMLLVSNLSIIAL